MQAALRAARADVVVSGEGEVALALTAAILQRLGATPARLTENASVSAANLAPDLCVTVQWRRMYRRVSELSEKGVRRRNVGETFIRCA
jgi:hypothetical protein